MSMALSFGTPLAWAVVDHDLRSEEDFRAHRVAADRELENMKALVSLNAWELERAIARSSRKVILIVDPTAPRAHFQNDLSWRPERFAKAGDLRILGGREAFMRALNLLPEGAAIQINAWPHVTWIVYVTHHGFGCFVVAGPAFP